MRRLIPWFFLAVLPIAACNAEQSSESAAAPVAASPPAATAPAEVAAATTPVAATASAGERYVVLAKPQPTQTPGKIEVVEVFLYTCPHCYAFDPIVSAWKKKLPADVAFVRVPASFGPTGSLMARSYYAAEALGVLEKMHPILFDTIHKQHQQLLTEEDVSKVFAANGVDPEAFRATLHSFSVDSKVRRAAQLEVAYGVTGVPAMTVNGKYGINIAKVGAEGMLKIAEELIAKERKAGG